MALVDTANDLLQRSPLLECSVGIMAHNEEGNIGRTLQALHDQETDSCCIASIIVLASGCTDNTEGIVHAWSVRDPRIRLIVQPKRLGKASAVNLFLQHADADILVLVGADTVPDSRAIQHLVAPFADPDVGMTGGRPLPVNDPTTFMGFTVHLLWELHHQLALHRPKMGEMIAFRRVFHRIPRYSAVDEANMEPLIRGQGYELRYVPEAIVYNRGPATVEDFLKQRRRIYAGHLRLWEEQGYAVATMSVTRILRALRACLQPNPRFVLWASAAVLLEAYGRFLGWSDYRFRRRDHAIWDVVPSTKGAIK